ncbi:MAG: hypothetical protein NT033_10620 [Candidatus Omnitrophica bacterium]|nr:hypothetical protein [Candidatus Omnitrophota bacterium]
MKNMFFKVFYVFFLLLFIAGFSSCNKEPVTVYYSENGKFSVPLGKNYNYTDVLVKRAVDGDTLVLQKVLIPRRCTNLISCTAMPSALTKMCAPSRN